MSEYWRIFADAFDLRADLRGNVQFRNVESGSRGEENGNAAALPVWKLQLFPQLRETRTVTFAGRYVRAYHSSENVFGLTLFGTTAV